MVVIAIVLWAIYIAREKPAQDLDIATTDESQNIWISAGALFILGIIIMFPLLTLRLMATIMAANGTGQVSVAGDNTILMAVLFGIFVIAIGFYAWTVQMFKENGPGANYTSFVVTCFTGALFTALVVVMFYSFHSVLKSELVHYSGMTVTNWPGAIETINPFG